MPASTQCATVPAAPKSTSSGCAATTSTRWTSTSGSADGGKKLTTGASRGEPEYSIADARSQRAAAGAQDQQGQLGAVGAERGAETVEDLPLAGEDQPGATGRHPGRADLLGDPGPFLPEPDQRGVDLVDALAQGGDVGLCLGRRLGQHGAAHLSAPLVYGGPLTRSTKTPR